MSRRRDPWGAMLVAILLVWVQKATTPQPPWAAEPVGKPTLNAIVEFVPHWNVGDRWIVETRSRQLQNRGELPADPSCPVRWEFHVVAVESIDENPCWRVEVRPVAVAPPQGDVAQALQQPSSRVWVTQHDFRLVRVESLVPSRRGMISTVETYTPRDGATTPVLGPLTVLPLDVPAFKRTGEKQAGEQQALAFAYTKRSAAAAKAAGDAGFIHEVAQEVSAVPSEAVKALAAEPFAKDVDLAEHPVVRVLITGPDRVVEQLWRCDQPWPLHASNGSTDARLVDVARSEAPHVP